MERKIGLSSFLALAKASAPHGDQSTRLPACATRYGLFSAARRFFAASGKVQRMRRITTRRRIMSLLEHASGAPSSRKTISPGGGAQDGPPVAQVMRRARALP